MVHLLLSKYQYLAVTGVGTNVGKTVVSAILSIKYGFSYWKPIQAGNLKNSDSNLIKYFTKGKVKIYPEKYLLRHSLSPHWAAIKEKVSIKIEDLNPPTTQKDEKILIECAGGIFTPINEKYTFIDYIKLYKLPFVLVTGYYVGCITHTISTIKALNLENLTPICLVFNGVPLQIRIFILDYLSKRSDKNGVSLLKFPCVVIKKFRKITPEKIKSCPLYIEK